MEHEGGKPGAGWLGFERRGRKGSDRSAAAARLSPARPYSAGAESGLWFRGREGACMCGRWGGEEEEEEGESRGPSFEERLSAR